MEGGRRVEDISAKIGEILRSPEQMQKLQNLASMLGLGGGEGNTEPPPPQNVHPGGGETPEPLSDLFQAANGSGLFGSFDPSMISSVIGLINKAGKLEKEDKGVALLRSLKPLLSEERSKRIDDAARILILARMFPLLRESGLLPAGIL